MEITLTSFQRRFSEVRKAADRGETVSIKAENDSEYIFYRRAKTSDRPFADLERLFGVMSLDRKKGHTHARVRRRLRKSATA